MLNFTTGIIVKVGKQLLKMVNPAKTRGKNNTDIYKQCALKIAPVLI